MRLELGSWRVWELWEEEWPRLVPYLQEYRWQLHRFWEAFRGRLREKDRGYVAQLLHEAMDLVTEGIRLLGHALVFFGYTISHVLLSGAIVWVLTVLVMMVIDV